MKKPARVPVHSVCERTHTRNVQSPSGDVRKSNPPDIVDLVLLHIIVGAVVVVIILVSAAAMWVAS